MRKHNTAPYSAGPFVHVVLVLALLAVFIGFGLSPGQAQAAPQLPATVQPGAESVVIPFTATCGDGWYPGNFTPEWFSNIRHGGSGGYRAILGLNEAQSMKVFTGGVIPWLNGEPMHLKLHYHSNYGFTTLKITHLNPAYGYERIQLFYFNGDDFNSLLLTGKTGPEEEGIVEISSVTINGMITGPCEGFTAQGSAGSRDIKHMLIENVNGDSDFILECHVTFAWDGAAADEGPALQIDAGMCLCHQPDLVISELDHQWVDANNYTVTYTVYNSGQAASGPATAAVSIDQVHQAGFDQTVPALDPGEYSAPVTVGPFALTEAEPVVSVCADMYDDEEESDENNNCMEIVLPAADLVVSDKYEEWIVEGVSYNILFTVSNNGTAPAAASTASVSVDGTPQPGLDTPVPTLATGETSALLSAGPVSATLPEDVIIVSADSADAVIESNEANNDLENTLSIPLPDLVVTDISEEWIVENNSYKVTATVVNNGNVDAGAFEIGLYIDGALSATEPVPSLVQGATMNVEFLDVYITQSSDTVKVWADNTVAVPEIDENNNWMENTWESQCPDWDLNCDHRCDALDFSLLSGDFNKVGPPGWIRSDYNDDGRVDALDFSSIFPDHWMDTW